MKCANVCYVDHLRVQILVSFAAIIVHLVAIIIAVNLYVALVR